MSMKDFVNEMTEEGLSQTSSVGVGIVGRVLIQFGVHRYVSGHDFWEFWAATKDKADVQKQAAKVNQQLQDVGEDNKANFGIKVTIFSDVLSAENAYKRDLMEFTPAWQRDAYDLVVNSVVENGLPVGKEFYGQVIYKANPFHVAKGEEGKTDTDQNGNPRFPSVRVPVQKFKDKTTAQAFVDANGASVGPVFSDYALGEYGNDPQLIKSQAEEISKYVWNAYQGINSMEGLDELPEFKLLPAQRKLVKQSENDGADFLSLGGLNIPDELKQKVAKLWTMELSDIDLLQQIASEAPF